jgi:hypothetical protein
MLNRDDILFYFTCIRISPLFPNWFINLCAPLTSISLKVFAMGSFIGLIPASVLGACVKILLFCLIVRFFPSPFPCITLSCHCCRFAGKELADLGAAGAQLHTQIFKIMVAVGSLAVLPAMAKVTETVRPLSAAAAGWCSCLQHHQFAGHHGAT